MLAEYQRTAGFAMQSLFIGLGSSIASALPWLLTNVFHVGGETSIGHSIPFPVRLAYYIGPVIYLIMPDRFANGDPSNDDPAISKGRFDRTKARYYHRGDLQ